MYGSYTVFLSIVINSVYMYKHAPREQHFTYAAAQTHRHTHRYTQTNSDCLLVSCLKSQQHARVSQGRICSDNFTCCHTETSCRSNYLTQSQYTDTGPTSPSTDTVMPGAWQGSHWSANFLVTGMTRPSKKSRRKRDSNPGSSALEKDASSLGQRGGTHSEAHRQRHRHTETHTYN